VRSAIVLVCREAFWYKDDVKALFVSAGTPERVWERHSGDDVSKAKTARLVLSELVAMGDAGARVQVRIAEELCRMDRPHPEASDPARGRAALDDLRREVDKHRLLSDPDKVAAQQRRATAEQRERATQARRDVLRDVHRRFVGLVTREPTTAAERQRRGYDFEKLLVDLFAAVELAYKPPYRGEHEQIDGSFHFRGFTYLVEAKWRSTQPDFGDLVKFKANVDGKLDSTRGMFISMAGYDENVLEHLLNVARGSRNNLVLVDAFDLISILEGRISLPDALIEKIDAAEQRGVFWHPLFR
jgi:hypothetical protein